MNKLVGLILLLLVAGGGYWGYRTYVAGRKTTVDFKTAQVSRGELLATIDATGTVEPEEVIDVGAQVAGQILYFGKDSKGKAIDYGSEVEENMVLAQIDESLYQADVSQQKAAVEQARASITRAEADLAQMKAKAVQAESDWQRAQKLGPSDALSQINYDAYRANFDSARAQVEVGVAAIAQAKAQLVSAQAGLQRAERNLGYCVIKSPVNGVIIDRRVNIGQTVVSSLNAPSLFLIAKDLKRIQVWVAVNEADIGQIHPGQPVTFTVDALSGRSFKGQVNKVRLNATMTSNVVTYTVEVTADNSDGKLLPYLTANAHFEVARHPDVLMVPNTALRWTPAAQYIAPEAKAAMEQRASRSATQPAGAGKKRDETAPRGTIWVKGADGLLRPIRVRTGPSDGAMTEISGKEIEENMEIVAGELRADAGPVGGAASPFQPQIRPGGGSRGGR